MPVKPRAKAISDQPYRVLVGINYPPNDARAEIGDIISDLPAADVNWMLNEGLIERAD